MKLLLKAVFVLLICMAVLYAVPRVGSKVLPSGAFDMHDYVTKKNWNLEQHMDGNTVIGIITGSIC